LLNLRLLSSKLSVARPYVWLRLKLVPVVEVIKDDAALFNLDNSAKWVSNESPVTLVELTDDGGFFFRLALGGGRGPAPAPLEEPPTFPAAVLCVRVLLVRIDDPVPLPL
jgi:hypothetical protein